MTDGDADVTRRTLLRTAAGAGAASTAVGTAAAQGERPVWPSYVSGAKGDTYEDLRGSSEVTVEVGVGSSGLAFAPTKVWIDPGTTVTFSFESAGHNVKPNTMPDGASWSGTEGGQMATLSQGATYEHTFETGGMYTYYCGPHEGLGMKGAIAVGGDVPTVDTGGQTPLNPEHMGVPFQAHFVGLSTIVMMVVSLIFTFFVLKYGESPHTSGGNN